MADDFDASKIFDLTGRVAVVTGGGTGLGAGIAKTFIVNGASKVYITGRRLAELEKTASEINALGKGKVIPFQNDVSSREGIEQLVDYIKSQESSLDILVNNAGVLKQIGAVSKQQLSDTATEAEKVSHKYYNDDLESWETSFKVNTYAPYFISFGLLPLLAKAAEKGEGRGNIINIASIAGVQIAGGNQSASYQASKVSALTCTKLIATRIHGLGVRVNAVAPGVFESDMSSGLLKANPDVHSTIPLGFIAVNKHLAGLILYLSSGTGAYTHGANHIIDGGRLLTIPTVY